MDVVKRHTGFPNSIPSGDIATNGSVQVITFGSVGNQITSNWIFIRCTNYEAGGPTLKWGPDSSLSLLVASSIQ